jgi:AcrR family transcriptional regulator
MGKSLTEVAKQIISEGSAVGGYPSVDPMGAGHPDRDARAMNPNRATLRPNSKGAEAPFSNPGAMSAKTGFETIADAPKAPGEGSNVGAAASGGQKKDTTIKGANAGGDSKPFANPGANSPKEVMEEDAEVEGEVVAEATIEEQIEAYIEQLVAEGHDEDTIAEAVAQYFGDYLGEEVAEEEVSYQIDMSEAIEALFAGEELSEEFKDKAKTIFEAAVIERINAEIKTIEEAYAETLEEQIEQIQEELSSNVDDYLNYVVEQWVQENEVAVEAGLRTELTEEFISGLRNLFAEHYIDIPEDKVSVVEEMGAKVAELESKLNEEIDRNVQLNKVINESKQVEVLSYACEGLTATQAEKLKSLSEGIEFTSVEEYSQKINILRESYFNAPVSNDQVLDKVESTDDGKGMIAEENSRMAAYARTLGRKLPN